MPEKAHKITGKVTERQHYTNSLNALLGLLEDGDEADRCYAAQALGKIKDPTTVAALIERLRDRDIDVCSDAAAALGIIGRLEAVPALLESLHNDPDGEVLMIVAEALGRIGGEEAISALLDIARKCPDHMEELEDDWDFYWDIQLKAVQALGHWKEERATPILLGLLEDEDGQDIESDILAALSKIEVSGEKALMELAVNRPARTRRRAVIALSNSTSEQSLDCILNALADPSPDVREEALGSLGKRKALQHFSPVLKLITDRHETVRSKAMEVALQFSKVAGKSPLLFDLVKIMIRDRHENARITALNIFNNLLTEKENIENISSDEGSIFDDDLLACLKAAIMAENANEVIPALHLLKYSDCEDYNNLLCEALIKDNIDPAINREAAVLLGRANETTPEIIDALEQSVVHENQAVRLAALDALSKLPDVTCGETDTLSPLKIILNIVKPVATAPTDQEEKAEPVEEITDDDSPPEQDTGPISTIGAIEQDNELVAKKLSGQPLKDIGETLEDLPADMREFGKIVWENMANFKPLAKRKHIDVQLDARLLSIRLLGEKIDDEDVFGTLLPLLDEGNIDIKREAIAALGQKERRSVSPETMEKIIALTGHGNAEVRIEAVRTMSRFADRGHIPLFIAPSNDNNSEVRLQALRAMERLINEGDADIIAHIATSLKDVEYGVRRVAIEILTSLGQQQELGNIIDTGFIDGGALSHDTGLAAKKFGAEIAAPVLLEKLETVPSSAERRFIIEMLQILYEDI